MPHYEYLCRACNKTFVKTMHVADHETGNPACPHCGGHEVEQRWSSFSAVTAKKS